MYGLADLGHGVVKLVVVALVEPRLLRLLATVGRAPYYYCEQYRDVVCRVYGRLS